jgi:hypothetical protein
MRSTLLYAHSRSLSLARSRNGRTILRRGFRAPGMESPALTRRRRASDGKPDLSGVWRVAPPPPDVVKVLRASERYRLALPGMELETTSKYGVSILADFKPEDSPILPQPDIPATTAADQPYPSINNQTTPHIPKRGRHSFQHHQGDDRMGM